MWTYDLCLATKPQSTLEIGMAYGFSTLYFLAAAAKNQGAHHTAIDPFQSTYWHGIGLTNANHHTPKLGPENTLNLIEDRSDRAAADLVRENKCYDLILIDGNHRFDDVLVDFICTNRSDFMEIRAQHRNVSLFQKISEETE